MSGIYFRDVTSLLPVSLDYLLLCEVPSLTSYASQCLQCCVERYRLNKQHVHRYIQALVLIGSLSYLTCPGSAFQMQQALDAIHSATIEVEPEYFFVTFAVWCNHQDAINLPC